MPGLIAADDDAGGGDGDEGDRNFPPLRHHCLARPARDLSSLRSRHRRFKDNRSEFIIPGTEIEAWIFLNVSGREIYSILRRRQYGV